MEGPRTSGCPLQCGSVPPLPTAHYIVVVYRRIPTTQVLVNVPLHAKLWDDHHHVSLAQLRSEGVWAPTIVWMSVPPADAYWQWARVSQAPLITVTTALPPFPWIAIALAEVAKFKYPAERVAHKCPGHPSKGPLYYSLNTAGTVPAELSPALRTHLREHHGDLAVLAPHGQATDPPRERWPPRLSRAFGSMTCRRWPLSAAPSPQWMPEPRKQAWRWRGSPRAGPRHTMPM